MTESNPFHRFTEAAAGHQTLEVVHPAISEPAVPSSPTETMVIAGVQVAPATRLVALARIRDGHRAAARAANDSMHSAREEAESCAVQIRMIRERSGQQPDARALAEIARLEAERVQWETARHTALAEAEIASASQRDAEKLLKTAIRFTQDHGAVLPVALAGEAR